ncbi:MAG: phage portal protein [Tissierellia bacterium]|nr:phage portal protein [Tissierellia bacterium]
MENYIFTFSKEEDITPKVVQDFIDKHRRGLHRYERLNNMYLGNYDILLKEQKAEYKPDNRLVVNYAKYLTDTFNGYFIGVPVQTSIEDNDLNESITEFRRLNSIDDIEAEISKDADIYGHGFEYLYQDEEANTRVTYVSPTNAFIVYDDTIAREPLFGVYYQLDGSNIKGELLTKHEKITLSGTLAEIKFIDEEEHFYGDVPLIEYAENEERKGIFESVETLINSLNKVLSEKANDVDYFSDAYLKILGADLDEETLKALRDNRVINLSGSNSEKVVVDFLDKPNADETQENLIDRLVDFIYQISMIANINDDTFNSRTSGVALQYKLLPMSNLAMTKERKFKASMMRRYKMIFNLPTNVPANKKDDYINIKLVFTRNVPNNIRDEVETAKGLASLTSQQTALSVLSVVDSPLEEIERMEKENSSKPLDYDFLKEIEDEQENV